MTKETKTMSGVILLSIPSIAYGGYFLLGVLSGNYPELELTGFQQAMFRAGHAHAGVLVILSLIAQIFCDHAKLSDAWKWVARVTLPASALLISGGFFAAAGSPGSTEPNAMIFILYLGIAVLVAGLVVLGVGLLRGAKN
jgi:Ni,Fe-hydrogenase I cytochrome b subunit